jgi:hypothetical protein
MNSTLKFNIFGRPAAWYFWSLLLFSGIVQISGIYLSRNGFMDGYFSEFANAGRINADKPGELSPEKYYFISGPVFPEDPKDASPMIFYLESVKSKGPKRSWHRGGDRAPNFFMGAKKNFVIVPQESFSDTFLYRKDDGPWRREFFEDGTRGVSVRRAGFSAGQILTVFGKAMSANVLYAEKVLCCTAGEFIADISKKSEEDKKNEPLALVIGIIFIFTGFKNLRKISNIN